MEEKDSQGRSEASTQNCSRRRITTFTLDQDKKGFRLMIAGCIPLEPSRNMPAYVRGAVRMQGKKVPVLDPDARAGKPPRKLTDESCVVLFEQRLGSKSVSTGTLFEDISGVIEMIRARS